MTLADYNFMCALLRDKSGLALPIGKDYLLESRLMPLVRSEGLSSLEDLIAAVRAAPDSAVAAKVVEAMTTNETLFFRDRMPFEQFKTVVAPFLREARAAEKRVRIWCAACSAGQEPYSLAIMLHENNLFPLDWNIEIVATDLSSAMIDKARRGIYSQFEVQRGLAARLLIKYFQQVGEVWQILPAIRAMVSFEQFNLLDNAAKFGAFDIIFCRNVLIYFDRDTKMQVFDRLSRQIRPDGYLVLGTAESVLGVTDVFTSYEGHHGLYRVVPPGRRAQATASAMRVASPSIAPARQPLLPAGVAVGRV